MSSSALSAVDRPAPAIPVIRTTRLPLEGLASAGLTSALESGAASVVLTAPPPPGGRAAAPGAPWPEPRRKPRSAAIAAAQHRGPIQPAGQDSARPPFRRPDRSPAPPALRPKPACARCLLRELQEDPSVNRARPPTPPRRGG